MLTGVFVIDKAGKTKPRDFYFKSAKKLGIPFVIFVVVYYVYDICIVKTRFVNDIYEGIVSGFVGMYAHWYMVMLAVIYAFLPLIAFIKNRVSYESWTRGVIVFFVWVMLGHYFEGSSTSWSLCNMYLMGYVLLGDVIHRKLESKQNNVLGFSMIGLGILILASNGVILYHVVLNEGDYYNKLLNLYGAPLIILASIIIFSGFTILDVKKDVRLIANISYIVFLSHKMIINIATTTVYPILEKYFNYNIRVLIPVEYVIVFPLSIILALIVYKLLNITIYRRS